MLSLDAETQRLLLREVEREVDPAFFDTWCRELDVRQVEEDLFEIPCQGKFWRERVEPKLRIPLEHAFQKVMGQVPRIRFQVEAGSDWDDASVVERAEQATPPTPPAPPPAFQGIAVKEDFTFDTLIEGPSNRFAISAGMEVAQRPFEHTLFVHGKSGVGKTHLLHAVCHLARSRNPDLRIVYTPCEAFISDFTNSIRTNRTEEFRARYKSIDFLVIDDVDLLAHKDATQNEVFHIFNHLAFRRRQVVLSSDSPPRQIHTLKERLFSRFESGLVVSVDPPEFEMRMAIINAKAERKGKELSGDVCRLIAENFTDNVREIEGAVIKVIALAHLAERPIDVDLAREALKDKLNPEPRVVTCDDVISMVAAHYRLTPPDLKRHTRKERVVIAKQVCLYLCHTILKHSTRELAALLNLASHNSVAVAVRRVRQKIERNPSLRAVVDRLGTRIKGGGLE